MAAVGDLCIAINPHHESFYRKAFGFEPIGGLKQYGKVNGAPALALRLDLDLLRTFISELRDGHPVESDVYTFLFSPGAIEPAIARLEADMQAGNEAGVNGTPAFFINGRMLSGAQPFDEFKRVIDEELALKRQ